MHKLESNKGWVTKATASLNQGKSLLPLVKLWVPCRPTCWWLLYRNTDRTSHAGAHLSPTPLQFLRQRHASQAALPFSEKRDRIEKKERRTRVWINSLPIYGLKEVLRLRSSKKCSFSPLLFSIDCFVFWKNNSLSCAVINFLEMSHKWL